MVESRNMAAAEIVGTGGSASSFISRVDRLALWRLTDASLPAGAFAHSLGVEAAVRHALVPAGEYARLVEMIVENAAAMFMPTVLKAHANPTMKTVRELSDVLNAKLAPNEVARKASVSNARGLARAAEAAFATQIKQRLRKEDVEELMRATDDVHHAAVFGLVARACGATLHDAAMAFLHSAARDATSALTRLGAIGPTAAASILADVAAVVVQTSDESVDAFHRGDLQPMDAYCATPMIELAQAAHGALQPRLFRS